MDKKHVRALIIIIFASLLVYHAVIASGTQYKEMAAVQDASRNLRRVNNIQYSYTTTLTSSAGTDTERVDVWGNQLTGEWVAEYYVTDEDGTRKILKSFCDGRNLYHYIEWTGDWEKQLLADTTMPSLTSVTSLTYGDDDIAEISREQEDAHETITVSLTDEYLEELVSQHYEEALELYEGYSRAESSTERQDSLQLGMERYAQIRLADAKNIFVIDKENVLTGVEYATTLYAPEVVKDADGKTTLGDEKSMLFQHRIDVRAYNRQSILDTIELCSEEVM